MAELDLHARRWHVAADAYEAVLRNAATIGYPARVLDCRIGLAHVRLAQKNYTAALHELDTARDLARKLGKRSELAEICASTGDAYRHLGREDEAQRQYKEAARLYRATQQHDALVRVLTQARTAARRSLVCTGTRSV
jgi:tetratricopeptide (TPR) repeat protein